MKEIKFRVWCKNKNEYETDEMLLASNGELFQQMRNGFIKKVNSNTHIVEWYTGLKDKNGVEIYEGDTLKNVISTITVGCSNILNCFMYQDGYDFVDDWECDYITDEIIEYTLSNLKIDDFRVIGNVHEVE